VRKFLAGLFRKLSNKLDKEDVTQFVISEKIEAIEDVKKSVEVKIVKPKKQKGPKLPDLTPQERAARDLAEMMEVPFLALSKNRREPIIYEKHDGKNMIRVKVSRHTGHFLASIYDWDIVLYVAGKMQEILNKGSDIPPRTMIIPRH